MPEPWRPTGNFKCVRGFFGELFIAIEEQRKYWKRAPVAGYQPDSLCTQTRWRTAKYKDLPALDRALAAWSLPPLGVSKNAP